MHECEICGNTFEIERTKEGGNNNDFGHIYCPYCGTQYDTMNTDDNTLTQPSN